MKHYDFNIQNNDFSPNTSYKKTYYIPMPPPNITGILHLGHATFLTIQDFLTRFYRKSGFNTLWLPGTDHAGIATHKKIIESFNNEDYTKDEYLERGISLKNKHHQSITSQMMRIGSSCDWNREQYTLNDQFITASTYALKELKNLLYYSNGQWYIDMKSMASELIIDIENGYFTINDQASMNELLYMLKNIEDWCISRQIDWGSQLPIYINSETKEIHILSDDEYKELNEHDKKHLIREKSCFDTWFTSSLYPFASLGWPQKTNDFKMYYPSQIIETGADILFFWCARMLMMGKRLTGTYPFKEIYLHGMCRDKFGKKMSKSLGNGIDPLDIINKYGADTLRYTILSKTTHKDIKLSDQDFLDSSKFMNKIWQSARFLSMHYDKQGLDFAINPNGDFNDELDIAKTAFIKNSSNRNFIDLIRDLQYSFKHRFCDQWIEIHKKDFFNGNKEIMDHGIYILKEYLNLFNCIIPFITDEISQIFFNTSLINEQI